MQGPTEDGYHASRGAASARETGSERELRPTPPSRGDVSTSTGTIAFVPHGQLAKRDSGPAPVVEDDRTVISQRPVAAPEEFYRSMPLSELAAMLEGRQLDHFAVEQMIGGGGMGAVFRGRDLRLDRVVAIKVIPAARRDAETLRRFRLEAQAAAKLDHPNIARVYYVGEAEQWNYIVFEFIDGVNIRDLVEMEGPLAVDDAVYYTRQVAEALQHAYEREVVHRDIKPSNVLVTATGAAKVVDMGLARTTALDRSTADETASGVTLGTFDYISPEQARNPRDADVRSDLYSLGCTLFYMLTGHPPFPEGTALQKLLSHGSQAPPDPRGWRDDLSDELYEITMKLMAKRPGDRYQTPAELISDLILLAEVEDLPRSLAPGTLLITPGVAQHSLLETNLPWLVAVAFLLGSTLWLASVEKLSNDFSISELNFETPAATTAERQPPQAAENAAATSPSASLLAVPGVGTAPLLELPPAALPPTALPPTALPPAALPSAGSAASELRGLTPAGDGSSELPTSTADGLPSAEAGGLLPPGAGSSLSAANQTLVVSAEMPADVDPQQWESSLATAVQRLESSGEQAAGETRDIEIRGPITLRRAVEIRGQRLRIVGLPGSGARLDIAPELIIASDEQRGAIHIAGGQLELRGTAVMVEVPDDLSVRRQGLFSLRGAAQLELQQCTVTVADYSDSQQYCVVSCDDGSGSAGGVRSRLAGLSSANPPAVSGSVTAASASAVVDASVFRASTCIFRGDASLIRLNITTANLNGRADLSLSSSLVALRGSVLEINAPTGEAQPQRNVRLLCDESTLVTDEPFAKLSYSGQQMPLVGLVRTSQSCIFWSPPQVPHVLINGARRQSVLGNFNLLLLQGLNNLYDAGIEELCRAYQGSEQIAAFGFVEAATSGWLAERGNESRVRWQDPQFASRPWRDALPADFAVADLLFVPGISPARLPNLDQP